MKYTSLGRTGLPVSRLCLGTMNFGPQTGEADSVATIELEVIPACRHYGVGLIPYSPLAGGLLGGALRKASEGRRASGYQSQRIERYRPQLEAYEALCQELGEAPSDIGLGWLLHNPAVTAPIIGPRTVEQMISNLRALEISISDETLKRLDEIWPGPGGEAPNAYAW